MERIVKVERITGETKINVELDLDGTGVRNIKTGVGYLDHMLEAWTLHGKFNLTLSCDGDLEVCPHHTVEDVAITLGKAFHDALGDRKGIARFATCYLPMDETLTRTSIDISGRPYHVFRGELSTQSVGQYPMEMVEHFFYSFAHNAGITLHQEILYGTNDHHKVESLYKGLSRSLADAVKIIDDQILSTKGVL
ncbi:MAG: imidazoleglycerol-phosphate dehydratase [bacterium]|jgi:imidazoleglycerol-phosphate dehydratase